MRSLLIVLFIVLFGACKEKPIEQILSRYANGAIKERITYYENDSLNQLHEFLSSSGELQLKGVYNGDRRIGLWEEYDSTTQTKAIGKYTSDYICDTFENENKYNPDYMGIIIDTVICHQAKDSVWRYFDKNNKIVKIKKYKNGKLAN